MGFEQATIKIEKEREFAELQAAITRAFSPEKIESFLKRVQSAGLRVRLLEPILEKSLLERVDKELAASGNTGTRLYQALTVPDQAQMREFYLSKAEEVSQELRTKFQKIYRYY